MQRRRRFQRGFTLIDLMLVVALIAILTTLSVEEYAGMVKRAKRVEAVVALTMLYKSQKEHYGAKDRYAANFDELDTFAIEGGRKVSSRVYQLRRYTIQLTQPWGSESYLAVASGQLDGDPWPDILQMRQLPPNLTEERSP